METEFSEYLTFSSNLCIAVRLHLAYVALVDANMSTGQSERGAPHPHRLLGAAGLLCILPEV